MRTVNLYEAKTNLSQLVEDAVAGEEIIIAKAGRLLGWFPSLSGRANVSWTFWRTVCASGVISTIHCPTG
jgi:hypothetical protein